LPLLTKEGIDMEEMEVKDIFGNEICECECHIEGLICNREVRPCCSHCYNKYLIQNGSAIELNHKKYFRLLLKMKGYNVRLFG